MTPQLLSLRLLPRAGLFLLLLFALGWMTFSPPARAEEGSPTVADVPSDLIGSYTTQAYALPGGVILSSSPAVGDLDGDGLSEIVIGTSAQNPVNGRQDRPTRLIAMKGNGTLLLNVDVQAPINSTAALGDLNGDGRLDIVIGVGADASRLIEDQRYHGGVVAYEIVPGNPNGRLLWRFDTQDKYDPKGFTDGVYSSPALCDLDNDNDLEVIFGAWDQRIYVLNHLGQSVWNGMQPGAPVGIPGYLNGDTVWSSPACADLDGDAQRYKEIVIGADISRGGTLPDGTEPPNGGYLYVFNKDGQALVRRYFPEAIYSSPAIGDLNNDGRLEIVVGTSFSWWQATGGAIQPYVYAFATTQLGSPLHYSDPAKLPHLPGWPKATAYPGYSSPTLADLDGNGDLEIIIGSGRPNGASNPGQCANSPSDGDCHGAVYAWHHDGSAVAGFPMWPKDYLDKNAFVRSSPIVADIDRDGYLEIVVSMLWDLILICPNGQQERVLHTTWTVDGTPALAETNGNGHVELWIGGGNYQNQSAGHLWRFEQTMSGVGQIVWPVFRHDSLHSGQYGSASRLLATPLSVMTSLGASTTSRLQLKNDGTSPVDWRITSTAPRVSVTTTSGRLLGHQDTSLPVTINTAGLAAGTHRLGNLVLEGTNLVTRQPVATVTLPVTLTLGTIQHTHIPLALHRSRTVCR